MSETVVPEGRGKAMALQSFLAMGGGLSSRGGNKNAQFLFRSGPMKGMTQDQAVSMFETEWAGASDTIKDKYARMGGTEGTLSPSEKAEYAAEKAAASAAVNDAAGVVNKPDTIKGGETPTTSTASTVAPNLKAIKPSGLDASPTPGLDAQDLGQTKDTTTSGQPSDSIPGRSTLIANGKIAPSATPPAQTQQDPEIQEILNRGPSDPITMKPKNPPVKSQPAPDFIAGQGKEWTGMSGGRRTYTSADELYGKAAESQTMEQRRNDYQVKNQTQEQRNLANESMRSQGITTPSARPYAGPRPSLPPRGPASQQPPAIIPREARPAPRADDPNIIKKDNAAYSAYQAGFAGASDSEFEGLKGGQQKIYDGASSMDQARLVANTLKRSGGQLKAAETQGEPYAPPPPMEQKRRKPIGRR